MICSDIRWNQMYPKSTGNFIKTQASVKRKIYNQIKSKQIIITHINVYYNLIFTLVSHLCNWFLLLGMSRWSGMPIASTAVPCRFFSEAKLSIVLPKNDMTYDFIYYLKLLLYYHQLIFIKIKRKWNLKKKCQWCIWWKLI